MNGFLSQVSEREHFRSKCSAQRVKMATLKIQMVIGLMALLLGGLGLNAVAQSNYPVVKKSTPTDTFKFYNGTELVRTQVVVAGDYLYEPQSPAVNAGGDVFTGWVIAGQTTALDFVNGVLAVQSVSGTTVRVNAQYETFYYATFRDQDGHIYSRLSVKAGEALTNAPTLQPKLATQSFKGWSLTAGSSSLVTFPQTLTGDVTYYPVVHDGYYIHFNANRSHVQGMEQVNVSYTAPVFVRENETTTRPADPVADVAAYTFDNWYTDANCTTPFVWGGTLTQDVELYANWNVGQAQYSVIIWQQQVTDDKSATGNNRHWDYVTSYTGSATIGSTFNYSNIRYSGNNIVSSGGALISSLSYTGFTLDHNDASVTVAADGSSVLNVYYRRNLMTINFYVYRRNNGNWDFTEDAYGSSRAQIWRKLTGLYGATFAQSVGAGETASDYVWPKEYRWYDGNLNTTLLTAFTDPTSTKNYYCRGAAGDYPVYHVRQKVDGSWPTSITETDFVDASQGSGGAFHVTNKYDNFTAVGYSQNVNNALNATGTSATPDQTVISSGYSSLAIYHARKKYPLVFYNGNTIVDSLSTQVYYEAPLSSYAGYTLTPTDEARYSFGGWATSPNVHDANQAVDLTTMEMPAPSLRLYAIWVSIGYNVRLCLGDDVNDANYPEATCAEGTPTDNAYMAYPEQYRSFWPTDGATVNGSYMMAATRAGYSLVGWFTPDGTAWDFANPVTKDLCDEGPTYDPDYKNYY